LGEIHADELQVGVPNVRIHGILAPLNGKLRYYEATS